MEIAKEGRRRILLAYTASKRWCVNEDSERCLCRSIVQPLVGVAPHLHQVLEHADGIVDGADFASLAIVPGHRYLYNLVAKALGDEQDLDVESPTLDSLEGE